MWFYANEDVTVVIDYMVDGDFVIPSEASYTLRSHNGLAVGSGVLTPTTTTATILVPAAANAIDSASLFENRFVLLKFTHNGKPYTLVKPYKLTNFVPMTATPDDVRRLTGLMLNELPDNDIDLNAAYFQLFDTYGTNFSNQLVATDFRGRQSNEAIALQAAIDIASSFPFRVPVSAGSEDAKFARVAKLDFAEMERELRRRLQQNLTQVISTISETSVGIFSVSSPTDPYTGA